MPPEHYKRLIPDGLGIVHTIVEVHTHPRQTAHSNV
jgi:hypothetical protein